MCSDYQDLGEQLILGMMGPSHPIVSTALRSVHEGFADHLGPSDNIHVGAAASDETAVLKLVNLLKPGGLMVASIGIPFSFQVSCAAHLSSSTVMTIFRAGCGYGVTPGTVESIAQSNNVLHGHGSHEEHVDAEPTRLIAHPLAMCLLF